jgi:hypothetical protein
MYSSRDCRERERERERASDGLNENGVLVGNFEWKSHVGDLLVDVRVMLKWTLKK